MHIIVSTVLALLAVSAQAVNPIVALDYATYRGVALGDGISHWLGMRYAAPPLDSLRFSAPREPPHATGIQEANKHGLLCLATNVNHTTDSTAEDCLFLDVYAPSSATDTSRLPVYFFIQGGGYNSNSNANYNGAGLIKASHDNIVVVNFNYRVGPWGFLAGREVLAGGSVNNGVKDVIMALDWVKKYISKFGGDPGHVTIGGVSAGAGAVTLLLTAHGGRDDGLFHAAAAESQSFPPVNTVAEAQYQYDHLVDRTDCARKPDTLACLRKLHVEDIQAVNTNIPYPGAQHPPLYMYGPVIDNDLITDLTHRLFDEGHIIKVPTIFGDDTNEGTIFVPPSTNTLAASDTFLKDQFPHLSSSQLDTINSLYPVDGTPQFKGHGRFFRQASNAYGDIRYTCPGLFCSTAVARHSTANVWTYLYNVTPPVDDGLGVQHTIEVNAIWGPGNAGGKGPASYYPGHLNANIVPVMQGYWTSFIRTYDPNVHRAAGSPEWTRWSEQGQQRIVFQTNASYIGKISATTSKDCAYLDSIAVAMHQ